MAPVTPFIVDHMFQVCTIFRQPPPPSLCTLDLDDRIV